MATFELTKVSPLKIALFLWRYVKCPNCGNKRLGEGDFQLTEKGFSRTCRCGHRVEAATKTAIDSKDKKSD
ncbi:DNA-directed RNA polymerase subunit RPC12/RpoP [Geomicrobium halophilum]|uniref:DNA-directed RNA polymerase subunit RPC12/RpoP n=1 Tax=Geomicrobium halophilum TaxID=549000 RepID=A0A841PM88_9BACL|nr:DUF3797 domain-containing protein [Geomicrobium halophilum]MBB6449849.1 DNA-directed RNA polymerase subunit RPC12/RpoP [Geomicrobium halophilum]